MNITNNYFTSLGARIGRRIDNALFQFRHRTTLSEIAPSRTRLSPTRLAQLETAARKVVLDNIGGDFIEFGTWRGGSLAFVATLWKELAPERALLGLDSFEGLPAPHALKDSCKVFKGMFGLKDFQGRRATDGYEDVQSFMTQKNLTNVALIKGWFEDSIPKLQERTYAFIHIDCDLYEGASLALQYAFPRLSPGGMLIVDDYGNRNCPGATIAVEEYFANREEVIARPLMGESCIIRKASLHTTPPKRSQLDNTVNG